GSIENDIEYATIKNATIGVLVEGNQAEVTDKLTIANSQIYNSSAFGILGRATSITAENVVLNNSGQSSVALTAGGDYNFTHCTIANYWNNSFREFPALLVNDFLQREDGSFETNPLTAANFNNCIIYGNDNPEFLLEDLGEVFNFKFNNCLLRFDNSTLEDTQNYMFDNTTFYEGNVFNEDPDFQDPFLNLMRIGENSDAIGIGSDSFIIMNDILGATRMSPPDAGAYNSTIFED
ncbi:MAG: hypothetical protein AAF901_07770, partial [Bacteroidota bacterium]